MVVVPHPPGRGQGWDDGDADVRAYVLAALDLVGVPLVGAYLHGSLAMGCYYRAKSDLDLILVVAEPLDVRRRAATAYTLARASAQRPTPGDLELSVLTASQAASTEHPRPFELHYSTTWTEAILAGEVDHAIARRDPDLAAHLTVVLGRGVTMHGPDPATVFAPVPVEHYQASIRADLDELLAGEQLLASPYYGVLNACRVLAEQADPGLVLSKVEGARWALRELPAEQRPIVEQSLACYRSARPVTPAERATDGHPWDRAALLAFRDHVRTALR